MGTVHHFFARGFIVGRDAFYSRSYVNSLQFQTVIYVNGTRLVCISRIEECLNKEVGAPIPGEHSSGSIPAVRCWSKPNYENRSRDIPETRNGSAPVVATQKPLFLRTRYRLAIFDQPGTIPTIDNFPIQIGDPPLCQIRGRFDHIPIHESQLAHSVRSSNTRLTNSVQRSLIREFNLISPYKAGPFSRLYERSKNPEDYSCRESVILMISVPQGASIIYFLRINLLVIIQNRAP